MKMIIWTKSTTPCCLLRVILISTAFQCLVKVRQGLKSATPPTKSAPYCLDGSYITTYSILKRPLSRFLTFSP